MRPPHNNKNKFQHYGMAIVFIFFPPLRMTKQLSRTFDAAAVPGAFVHGGQQREAYCRVRVGELACQCRQLTLQFREFGLLLCVSLMTVGRVMTLE